MSILLLEIIFSYFIFKGFILFSSFSEKARAACVGSNQEIKSLNGGCPKGGRLRSAEQIDAKSEHVRNATDKSL